MRSLVGHIFHLGKRGEKKEIADMLRRKVCVFVKGSWGFGFGAVGLIANLLEDYCLGISDCHS